MLMNTVKKLKTRAQDLYAAPVTIAFIGDSVTQGCFEFCNISRTQFKTVFKSENSFAACVRKIFSILYPTIPVNIINAGVSGDNAESALCRLDKTVLDFHPDLVVVGFGLNDSTRTESNAKEIYLKSLDEIFKRVTASGAECIFLSPNYMNREITPPISNDKESVEYKSAVTCMEKQTDGTLDDYIDAAKKIAEQNGITICDIYSYWRAMVLAGINTTELLANKINHPIKELHWFTAMKIVETIIV